MPLGEMVDLERLAQMCKEKNRWTFFVTSAPANVPGELPLLLTLHSDIEFIAVQAVSAPTSMGLPFSKIILLHCMRYVYSISTICYEYGLRLRFKLTGCGLS